MTASVAERLAAAGCLFPAEEAAILVTSARSAEELEALVVRRTEGEPLEHVVGWTTFHGLRLEVDPGLFVPRPRSELLVEETASLLRSFRRPGEGAVVVDLCCGIGAIGAALAAEVPGVTLHAADIDPRAVACARRNLARWSGTVHLGDLFAALPRRLRGRVDVLVSSPPYVPPEEIRLLPAEARDFEPRLALDGGSGGLAVAERIAREAREWLVPDGHLAVEAAEHQVERLEQTCGDLGYAARAVTSDGAAVVLGRLPR